MNTPIRRIAIAVMAMILLLLGNLTYVQVVKAGDYREDSRNKRVLLAEYARKRGQISAGGKVLASSVPSDDELKYQRQYPDGPVYAPLTGYYSTIYGPSGLERAADGVLNGSDDRLFVRRVSDLITGRDPSGGNVVLTIDPEVQQTAFDQLQSKGYTGSIVALRPQTGEILGMVSTPSYDPGPLASHRAEEQKQAWTELNDAEPAVLPNRAISERYPPGSTFKLIDVAAALSSGRYTPDSPFTAAPSIILEGTRTPLPNFGGNRCGGGETATLREALQRSCNTAFAELSAQLGPQAIQEQAAAFGIGSTDLTIPLKVAGSTLGDIENTAQLQQSSIGQASVALTPLQNAMIAAAIANGGEVMRPYLIKEIQDQELNSVETTEPDRIGPAIDSGVASTMTEMMVNNENSYAPLNKIRGVQIAAKTGTAQHGADDSVPPHVWYVGFAPAEDPQVAVAVLVESGGDPNNLEATGGQVAAPLGRAVISAALGESP
ncbi:peptidoglycan D,D-transpeptidase FtsI family protein [Pseudonocardia humida]|uniref:Penicillin-binding protein 2 n=1 Tax=Pseudonocardia humida TaxID=2800819 RepID=A0ABT1A4T2_9PSEU|nr:penicillin-binding protein 2 [Pseudonocardia humida]MCO1658016.1 penicillin-binding protein 2 [Pseudonocardia humida]